MVRRNNSLQPKLGTILRQRRALYTISFAVMGAIVLLLTTKAAPLTASLYADLGNLSSPAVIINDATAADGRAVLFSGTTNPNPIPTPLPSPGTWTNVTTSLANMSSECGNLSHISAVPGSSKILAGIAQRGIWSNTTSGGTWSHLGDGSGSAVISNRTSWITYDPNNPNIFWESGIYNFPGVLKTTDGGQTFQQLGNAFHNDFISVDFSDPNRQTLLAGGHEQARQIYKSTDGGQTWNNIGGGLPADSGFSTSPIIINSQTYVVNTTDSWAQGDTPGIYRTTNGGATWTKVSSLNAANAPLITSTGAIYWSSNDGLAKSTDSGQTWTQVGSGFRGDFSPIELPDGRIVTATYNTLVVSADGGATWTPFGANLPYNPGRVIYSQGRGAFFISNWDCGNVVLPNAIMQLK